MAAIDLPKKRFSTEITEESNDLDLYKESDAVGQTNLDRKGSTRLGGCVAATELTYIL
jgi:hypothetical protein